MIKHNLFSLCFGNNAGYFSVGKINKTFHDSNSTIVYLKRNPNNFFFAVELNRIEINGSYINTSYNTIIDSGTTYSLFPEEIYTSMTKILDDYSQKDDLPAKQLRYNDDYCFELDKNSNKRRLYKALPTFHFHFENQYSIPWKPKNYIVEILDDIKGVLYCVGISILK